MALDFVNDLLDFLGGDDSETSATSNTAGRVGSEERGTSTTTGTEELDETSRLESLLNLIERLDSSAESTVQRGGEFVRQIGADFLESFPDFFNQFSKEAAVADSAEAVDAVVSDVLNRNLPDVRSSRTISGGYDDTTTKLLTDDIIAQASAEGAKVRQDTIANYANVALGARQGFTNLIDLGLGADVTTKGTETAISESEQVGTELGESTSTLDTDTTTETENIGLVESEQTKAEVIKEDDTGLLDRLFG